MKKLKQLTSKVRSNIASKNSTRKYAYIFALLFAALGSLLLIRSFAATGQFVLTPSTLSVENGQTFTVQVRLNPGDTIFGVEDVIVNFNPNQLEYVSVDTTGAYFENLVDPIITSNGVEFNQGSISKTTNTEFLIGTITFRAKVGTGSTQISINGLANNSNNVSYAPNPGSVSITLTSPPPSPTTGAAFTIESTNPTPVLNGKFGLKVYVESTAKMQGGEVKVNLPAGLAYDGTLTNTGSAFSVVQATELDDKGNPCTSSQKVCLAFATQSQTLTGKQLVTTIPVTATTVGSKSVTFADAVVVDISDNNVTTSSTPFSITVSSPITAPTVSLTGGAALGSSTDTRNMTQSFTITNFDSAATYAVTIAGQSITQASGVFTLPQALRNGDHTLQVTVTKSGASATSSYTIRLRSYNVDRTGCVGLRDLLAVNKAYGTNSAEYNLDYSTTTPNVGLTDLLLITANWGKACVV